MIANTTPIAPQSSDALLISRGTQIPPAIFSTSSDDRADEARREQARNEMLRLGSHHEVKPHATVLMATVTTARTA